MCCHLFFFLMIRRPPRSTLDRSSAASDVYKRQVRRPNNENLFSIGKIFSDKAYDCKYIYGGYSYFDNMNYYFSNNHYEVVDRMKLKDSEVDYENVWGVADENLFSLSLREIEKSVTNGKLFFTHIMTTSNHRPYTYPCLLYTSPSPRDRTRSRMPSSACKKKNTNTANTISLLYHSLKATFHCST